jgi:hypothetical protein
MELGISGAPELVIDRIDGAVFRSCGIREVNHVRVVRAYNALKEHV